MNRILQGKKANSDSVNRALALALRSPIAAAAILQRGVASAGVTRHGQRANPVPLTRYGKPNT